ncbi:hypothetical protein QBC38DRAFT_420662 [Podospora fimiseda]|uniref:Uncharacterized protein n=1 Tax=Podospora fimiseda TaxID=252190 RepID=A0AAN7BLG1_9PEZI|nr:hypothetical protein QBC38DRAFT_420662 [Podospora fimiseda]
MAKPPPLFYLLFLLLSFISLTSASPQTFCKCTCFQNSTIIPLGPSTPNQPPSNANPPPALLDSRSQSTSCTQCNRAFCLKYNLPICKDAEEKDIVTLCFQRDSQKDQFIVWGFILGTAGLLGWAGVKKILEGYEKRSTATARGGQDQGVLGRVVRIVGGSGGQTQQTGGGVIRRGGGGGGQEGGSYAPLG